MQTPDSPEAYTQQMIETAEYFVLVCPRARYQPWHRTEVKREDVAFMETQAEDVFREAEQGGSPVDLILVYGVREHDNREALVATIYPRGANVPVVWANKGKKIRANQWQVGDPTGWPVVARGA